MTNDDDESSRSAAEHDPNANLAARRSAEQELFAAKEALREREELLRATFSQAAVGIALATLDGRFIEVNRKFCEILGYTSDELLGKTFTDITHPADLARTKDSVGRLLAGEIRELTYEKRYVRRDGSSVWSLASVTLLRDVRGAPHRYIGVIEDITARKRAEDALRDESSILELLNASGASIASNLDLQTVVQTVTDAAKQLSGAAFGAFFYNVVDTSGESYVLYALSGATRAQFETLGLPRNTPIFNPTFRGEGVVRSNDIRKDPRYGSMEPHHGVPRGHVPVVSYLAVPVVSRSGGVLGGLFFGHPQAGVFTERSERIVVGVAAQASLAIDNARLLEAALRAAEERKTLLENEREARAELQRVSEIKDEFLATLSHELRTPLNAILGWSQLLRLRPMDAEEMDTALDTIERNARVQTQLIEDLLDMSRITSGKLRLEIQTVQPIRFVTEAVQTVRPAAEAKGIRIETLLDAAAGVVAGDPGRLQQVVWNLVSNAIKFTPKGGVVSVVLQRAGAHVELVVADSGIGIDPAFQGHIFERFRQADASSTRKYGGLGLGLSIVQHLVELHGGTVRVHSDGEGRGATFTVQLPVSTSAPARADEPWTPRATLGANAADYKVADLSRLRVLVVDDEHDARALVGRVLADCGADVTTAADAIEALEHARGGGFDVLVSDIGMPPVDGYELLRHIRALEEPAASLPAIALTAFARSEDRTRALREGYQMHLSKPVEPSELVATVASVARRAGRPLR